MKKINNIIDSTSSNKDKTVLKIYTLGRFWAYYKEESVVFDFKRSKKVWELFVYLLSNRGKVIPPEVIAEALWPEQEFSNPSKVIKNLVYRLRKRLNAEDSNELSSAIIYRHGCYGWNTEIPCWIDVEDFEKKFYQAKLIEESSTIEICERYMAIIEIYKGHYLTENPYSDWIMPFRRQYRNKYISSAHKLLNILYEQGKFQKLIDICETIFLIEPFEEDFHLLYINALLGLGYTTKARSHYEFITSLYYNELGVKPTHAMRSIYNSINDQEDDIKTEHLAIQELLQDFDQSKGPLMCKPNFFELICKLEKRRMEREEHLIQLGLLTFQTHRIKSYPGKNIEEAMDLLNTILSETLRKGDAYTAWNNNQYAILLPSVNREFAEKILQRIVDIYISDHPHLDMTLQIDIYQLLPGNQTQSL